MVKITYKVGDKVFAKVKGYPPWPAEVVSENTKTKKYNVLFFGTKETGAIKPEDLSFYLKHKDSIIHKYTKRAGYGDAVKQIEEAIKKDGGDGDNAEVVDDSAQDIDMSDASSVSSVSEKKPPKRKATSLPLDEPTSKKNPAKGRRRKSVSTSESKEDNSEEPALKKPRRKSSTASKDEDAAIEKPSDDNGIKEETPEELKKETEENVVEPESQDNEKTNKPLESNETEPSELEITRESKEETELNSKEATTSEKPKEPESVEIKSDDDERKEEESPEKQLPTPTEKEAKSTPKTAVKVEIITEQFLNNHILYAGHVKKNPELYKDKPVEWRRQSRNEVLPVKLPSGIYCGIKLHKEWPLAHSSEHERALYDEKIAKQVLEIKDQLSSGKNLSDITELEVVPDLQKTMEDIKEICYARDIQTKRTRLERLRKEADLVSWDSKIKNTLGLDKATPDSAIDALKEFSNLEKNVDDLMFKKHPHVLDTVRRLRKYVGNVKEWNMSLEDIEVFTKKAETIRNEAEDIYNKIKKVMDIPEVKGTFWDAFMNLVAEFRTKCKDLSESEVLVLCAEPDSRQAFLDKLDEVSEFEANASEPTLKETSVQD